MISAPHFVVNPAAASGRAERWWNRAWPVLRKRFAGASYSVAGRGSALADSVLRAVDDNHREIVGVGGDGTHHLLVNALVARQLCDLVTYAPLPLGTGNDWCRTLSVPRHLVLWMDTMERGRTLDHRIGRLEYGNGTVAHFINAAGMAYDAEVVRRSEGFTRKSRLLYPLLTATGLAAFRPPALTLTYDGSTVEGRFHTINLGLGRYCGGGMQLLPQADPTADRLALTFAGALPIRRILANGWRFYSDSIGRVPGVTTVTATRIEVRGDTGLEADGEWLGRTPVVATLAKERLRVRCGEPQ